jgi:hypothetical protein
MRHRDGMGPSLIGEAMADLTDKLFSEMEPATERLRVHGCVDRAAVFREVVGPYLQMCEDIEALTGDGVVSIGGIPSGVSVVFSSRGSTLVQESIFSADTLPAALRKAAAARAEWEAANAK